MGGCVVTDGFLQRLHGEEEDAALTRAAQQIAMFRALGYAGADLGHQHNRIFLKIYKIPTLNTDNVTVSVRGFI